MRLRRRISTLLDSRVPERWCAARCAEGAIPTSVRPPLGPRANRRPRPAGRRWWRIDDRTDSEETRLRCLASRVPRNTMGHRRHRANTKGVRVGSAPTADVGLHPVSRHSPKGLSAGSDPEPGSGPRSSPPSSDQPAVVGPMQRRLSLPKATEELAPIAIAPDLLGVAAHAFPATDLAIVSSAIRRPM